MHQTLRLNCCEKTLLQLRRSSLGFCAASSLEARKLRQIADRRADRVRDEQEGRKEGEHPGNSRAQRELCSCPGSALMATQEVVLDRQVVSRGLKPVADHSPGC
ncbi:hypothetical protein RRG08_044274 [Elysia crispata]|uniref:Uncharacterized protein n=1 Tax=Elysia crispata TaxID=231223 RepID=A0AAE0XWS7_9GAST|nr:hypothetical protein RRG08_044274 [Elysia crispata]